MAQMRVNIPVKNMEETNRGFRPMWSRVNMQKRYEGISEKQEGVWRLNIISTQPYQ